MGLFDNDIPVPVTVKPASKRPSLGDSASSNGRTPAGFIDPGNPGSNPGAETKRTRPTLPVMPAPAPSAPRGRPSLVSVDKGSKLNDFGSIYPPTPEAVEAANRYQAEKQHQPYLARGLPLLDGARGTAEFSEDGRLRYTLWRYWDEQARPQFSFVDQFACFIGMNPSVAGALEDDKTVRNNIEFTRRIGYRSLCMVNLSPLCATDSAEVDKAEHAKLIGDIHNEMSLIINASNATRIICAWGVLSGRMREYAGQITRRLLGGNMRHKLYCYGVTSDGSPRHTSRLAYDTPLEQWKGYP